MDEALRILLLVLLAVSLVTIAAYLLMFVGAAVWTIAGAKRVDAMEEELGRIRDRVLAEDLDRVLSEIFRRSAGRDT